MPTITYWRATAPPLGVVARRGEIRRERTAGDQRSQLGGQYRSEHRGADAGEQEGRAPDRGEQQEPRRVRAAACLALLFQREKLPLARAVPRRSRPCRRRCAPRDGRARQAPPGSRRRRCRPRAPPPARRWRGRSRWYVRVSPRGMRRSSSHTRRWNTVPRMSSGSAGEARLAFDEGEDLGFQVLQSRSDDFGGAELLGQQALEALGIIARA